MFTSAGTNLRLNRGRLQSVRSRAPPSKQGLSGRSVCVCVCVRACVCACLRVTKNWNLEIQRPVHTDTLKMT